MHVCVRDDGCASAKLAVMGCSPSALLEHIHSRERAGSAALTNSRTTNKKSDNQQVHKKLTGSQPVSHTNRKGSLPFTPEDEGVDISRVPIEGKYGVLLPANRNPPRCLLVHAKKDDHVFECVQRAANSAGFETNTCHGSDTAMEEYQARFHDLVILDARYPKLDADTLCRSIRNTKGNQHTVIVAIVKRSVFEKDDVTVPSFLNAGFNRCVIESTNVTVNINELLQIKHSDIRPQAQSATTQALYAALDKTRDLVHITDDTYRVQYTNRSSERYLGYRQDELIGKSLLEQFIQDSGNVTHMNGTLQKYKEWDGPLLCRRKTADPVNTQCRVTPVCTLGRTPTHYVFVQDAPADFNPYLMERNERPEKPRGSVHSLRRGSFDVRSIGSDNMRRTSLAKLHAMPLEAPITKVIGLICSVQESASAQHVQMLDKVIDILRSTELYSPQMKEDHRVKSEDPVTTDLIGALLTQGTMQNTSRRSSNDSTVVRSHNRHGIKHKVPAQLKDLLDASLSWEFDIFRLEELSNKRPLVHIGMNLLEHFDVAGVLNCDEKIIHNWLTVIENHYHADNTYHNSTHAADVLQATACFLEKERIKALMEPMDEVTSLIAAIAHDVDHPGKSSAFLCNSDSYLAILYNDISVLESHHAAITFKLTLSDDRVNIFKNLDKERYKIARHNVVDMILATEMTKHFEHFDKFENIVYAKQMSKEDPLFCAETEDNISAFALPSNIQLVKRMMIKCADVSNPARPLKLCVEWARRIAEEYFNQTDEERNKNLPVVMPMFDRASCSIPKSQIGFIDYIVHDMFATWQNFIEMPELLEHMTRNHTKWEEFEQQGLTTLHDIKKLQSNILLNPKFGNTPTTPE